MENRVGFGPRLGALLMDIVLVTVIGFIVAPVVGGIIGGAMVGGAAAMDPANAGQEEAAAAVGGFMGMLMGAIAAMGLVGTLYFLVEAFTGWTLGKLILGLRIGTDDAHQAPVPKLLMRYAVKNIHLIFALVAAITGVGILGTVGQVLGLVIFIGMFLVFSAARQTLHDKVAKTAVYKKADLQPASAG